MPSARLLLANNNAVAWLLMISALALHVLDEALTGFLPFYNELVSNLRERLGFFPMPTFSHSAWLGGLVAAIVIGFCATPLVYRGARGIRIVALVLGVFMIVNAGAHMLGSLYFGRLLPGFWSSPLLLVSSLTVIYTGLRRSKEYGTTHSRN